MLGDGFPTLAVVQLHPIVLTVLNLSAVLQCLGEQITQEVVVRGVLESKVADVAQVLVELVCGGCISNDDRRI